MSSRPAWSTSEKKKAKQKRITGDLCSHITLLYSLWAVVYACLNACGYREANADAGDSNSGPYVPMASAFMHCTLSQPQIFSYSQSQPGKSISFSFCT